MNRTQLIDDVALRTGLSTADAGQAVTAVLEAISAAVAGGEKVTLPGFGVFEPRHRPARAGRNPRTGEPLEVPAATIPAFKPGADLKRRVAGA